MECCFYIQMQLKYIVVVILYWIQCPIMIIIYNVSMSMRLRMACSKRGTKKVRVRNVDQCD